MKSVHTAGNRIRTLTLDDPAVLKALGHPLRATILTFLEDAPASEKVLASELGETPGRINHHLRMLERAGLVEVVEERPVRAVVERFYAPTFDRLAFPPGDGTGRVRFLLEQAGHLVDDDAPTFDPPGRLYTVRMSSERAAEFAERLVRLADEFAEAGEDEGEMHALAAVVYRTGPGRG